MILNEIKKELYKKQPFAHLWQIRSGTAYYTAALDKQGSNVFFEIPVTDMGNAPFYTRMDAKLLIRWIVKDEV